MSDEVFPCDDADRARDHELGELIARFPGEVKAACDAISQAIATMTQLQTLYDVEITESSYGHDAVQRLNSAQLDLRHVELIAEWRVRIDVELCAQAESEAAK